MTHIFSERRKKSLGILLTYGKVKHPANGVETEPNPLQPIQMLAYF
jgi:hypothetical protein